MTHGNSPASALHVTVIIEMPRSAAVCATVSISPGPLLEPAALTSEAEPCDCPAAMASRGGHFKVTCKHPRCQETWWYPLCNPPRRLLGHRDDPYR